MTQLLTCDVDFSGVTVLLLLVLLGGDTGPGPGPGNVVGGLCGGPVNTSSSFCVK